MTIKTRKPRVVANDAALCPHCESSKIKARAFSDTVDLRGLTIDVEGLQETKCTACGYVWASATQHNQNNVSIRTAYALTRDKVRQQQGLLSGPEIEQVRAALKLTQREASGLFGGGLNAFNKYESGEVLQSFAMDRLLRLTREMGAPAVRFLREIDAPRAVARSPAPLSRHAPLRAQSKASA